MNLTYIRNQEGIPICNFCKNVIDASSNNGWRVELGVITSERDRAYHAGCAEEGEKKYNDAWLAARDEGGQLKK